MDLSFCFFCFWSICSSILLLLFLLLVKGSRLGNFAFGSSKRKFYYHLPGDMNIIMQNLTERLRPLVGFNGWDYCVSWKLSEDQRFLEWLGCCCGGSESNESGGEEHLFPVSSCRDTMFPHPRTKPCHLLSQLSSSIPIMDSGIHAQTLLTNQANWMNYSNTLNPNILETQVLIPVPGGLVELFVTKQIPEDQQVIDFITAQCIALVEQEPMNHSISFNMQPNPIHGDENEALNLMEQFNYNRPKNDGVSEEPLEKDAFQKCLISDSQYAAEDPMDGKENNKDSNSMSDCSDQNEEEEDGKCRRRNGKGNQSKNLVAERKRRKKLNDRLYNLRSLVPRISKLDRASILGDAIEYVKDLQKQVKELQDELEENSDTGVESNCVNANNNNNNQFGPKDEQGKAQTGFHVAKPKQEDENKQIQQMEAQVEVAVIEGNEYFVKVFCEHRQGGFVKLMEALNTLGMDVVHATVTSHKGLVSNVFKVEKKESAMVEAEDVRESLLELTRNGSNPRGWTTDHQMIAATSENAGRDQHHFHC